MKVLISLLIIFFVLGGCSIRRPINDISIKKGYKLDYFYRAGTTAQLRNLYNHYFNDSLKSVLSKEKIQKLIEIMDISKIKKHRQKKIVGIYEGIVLCSNKTCFCLLLTRSTIYDISNNIEYIIPDSNQSDLKELFNN